MNATHDLSIGNTATGMSTLNDLDEQKYKLPPKNQRGVVEMSIITLLVIMVAVALLGAWLYPTISYQMKKTQFTTQYNQIKGASDSWKGAHNSYAGISLVALCNEGQLSANSDLCLAPATANPFGGSWAIAAGANTSQLVATATNVPATNGANLQRDMATIATAVLAGTTLTITQ